MEDIAEVQKTRWSWLETSLLRGLFRNWGVFPLQSGDYPQIDLVKSGCELRRPSVHGIHGAVVKVAKNKKVMKLHPHKHIRVSNALQPILLKTKMETR